MTYTDDITVGAKDIVNDAILDATKQVSEATGTLSSSGDRKDDTTDDVIKSYSSEVSLDDPSGRKKSGTFKVAIEVNVTNEKRRGSLETFEKTLAKEKIKDAEQKSETAEKSE
ncbi:uncharacterized protein LOC144414680 [Styela clava]